MADFVLVGNSKNSTEAVSSNVDNSEGPSFRESNSWPEPVKKKPRKATTGTKKENILKSIQSKRLDYPGPHVPSKPIALPQTVANPQPIIFPGTMGSQQIVLPGPLGHSQQLILPESARPRVFPASDGMGTFPPYPCFKCGQTGHDPILCIFSRGPFR